MTLNVQQRAWDDYDAYLFDIDGTLLQCRDAVHYFAFCDTLTWVAGRPMNLDGVIAHGNTDVGILRDAFRLAGTADAAWRSRLPAIRDAMCLHVETHQSEMQVEVLPGVARVLEHLGGKGAARGVATGNLEAIGRIKLARGGLLQFFDFGGYSDAFEERADVFAAALAKARLLAGAHAAVCVVGDTPADVKAARANGLDVIAVATGVYTHKELEAAGPTRCVSSLLDLFADGV